MYDEDAKDVINIAGAIAKDLSDNFIDKIYAFVMDWGLKYN